MLILNAQYSLRQAALIFVVSLLLNCSAAAPAPPSRTCASDPCPSELTFCCKSSSQQSIANNIKAYRQFLEDDEDAFLTPFDFPFALDGGVGPPQPKRPGVDPAPHPKRPALARKQSVSFNEAPVLASDGSSHTLVDGPKGRPKRVPPEEVRRIRLERKVARLASEKDTDVPFYRWNKEQHQEVSAKRDALYDKYVYGFI